jgi:nucleoside 2-deoxyribosyltransferase
MKLIYLAGAYSAGTILEALDNVAKGLDLACDLEEAGYAVYAPWTDIMLHTHRRMKLKLEYCYEASLEIMRRCDAVIVEKERWELSKGTVAELTEAKRLGIPVFWEMADLLEKMPPRSEPRSEAPTTRGWLSSLWNFAKGTD